MFSNSLSFRIFSSTPRAANLLSLRLQSNVTVAAICNMLVDNLENYIKYNYIHIFNLASLCNATVLTVLQQRQLLPTSLVPVTPTPTNAVAASPSYYRSQERRK